MTPGTFGPNPSRRRVAGYALAVAGTGLLVPLLLSLRDDVDVLTLGWGFLAWVVIVAAVGGLGPGIAASFLAFGAYNFFFFPPFHTFRVTEPEHIVVLFVFLGISVLIAVLLASARSRAETAQAREQELRLQQDLATALVDPSPDNERYGLVLRLIVTQLRLDLVDLYVTPPGGSGIDLFTTVTAGEPRGTAGAPPWESDAPDLERLPLIVGRRNLGLLVARGEREPLTAAERRILGAFSNQLALVLERDRLLRASVARQAGRAGST